MFKWFTDLFRTKEPKHKDEQPVILPMVRTEPVILKMPEPTIYAGHPEAVIVSCFYNPQNSPYRLLAFQKWYRSIKHLNHRIIECLIGEEAKRQLPESRFITELRTESLLWHKETLINKIVSELPPEYRYVFWVDADVLFTNMNWLVDSVRELQGCNILQPFEYCIHLDRNQTKPDFDVDAHRGVVNDPKQRHPQMWRSFCANYIDGLNEDSNYDRHGHVGFAWGARREVLEKCPLYDRALIGGSDHILAHAAAGDIGHLCITKSFTENIEEVEQWMRQFYDAAQGKIGFVKGDLYHIWHGDVQNRQYLKRIRDFTPETKRIDQRDQHGLHVKPGANAYMKRYYRQREVTQIYEDGFDGFDAGFYEDMGYMIWDIYDRFGRPAWVDEPQPDEFIQDVPMDVTPDAVQTFPDVPQIVPAMQDYVPVAQSEGFAEVIAGDQPPAEAPEGADCSDNFS